MYQITCDDNVLYDVRLKNRIVLSPTLKLETKKNGTLSFTVPPQNDLYSSIQQKKSIIKVFQVDKINNRIVKTELFRGTVYSETTDFYNRKQVECEGELSFFNDSIVRPYNYQGDVLPLFQKYINEHNSQVNADKRFVARRCTVMDQNDYITRANINYPTTKNEMEDKLLELLGGHFETGEDENGNRYIDYLAEYENISSQYIEFGKNELDITQYIKTEDVATRIIPLGKKNEETGEYLTIKSVNNGLDYIQDDAAVALFGIIEKKVVFEDVTLAENLLRKGQAELQNLISKTVSIEISAADLHNLDVNIEAFRIGQYVRVLSKPHGLDRQFLLSKMSIQLDNPSNCEMTLGATFKSSTQKQIEAEKKLNATVQNTTMDVTEIKQNVESLNTEMQDVNIVITDLPTDYVKTMTFNAYKVEVNQKLVNVCREKGTVADYAALLLLEDNEIGDIYKTLDSNARYIFTETGWDKLCSDYYTKDEIDQMLQNL